MDSKELFKIIETQNKEKYELKNSREYKLGKNILETLNFVKKGKFNKILKKIHDKNIKNKITKFSKLNNNILEQINNDIDYRKSKIAIYTCIIGDYDNIQVPLTKFSNVDYYLFTDNVDKFRKYSKNFIIKEIDNEILKLGKIIANRYIKLHPSEVLGDYDFYIYVDGNVRIISDIRRFITKINDKTGIAMHLHRERNCIYDEVKACILLKRGSKKMLLNQINRYQKEGFPKEYGMNEATIIVSNNKKIAINLLNQWYKEFIKSNSLRDQIAWPYVLWKNNLKIFDVGILGDNIYNNYTIEMVQHK